MNKKLICLIAGLLQISLVVFVPNLNARRFLRRRTQTTGQATRQRTERKTRRRETESSQPRQSIKKRIADFFKRKFKKQSIEDLESRRKTLEEKFQNAKNKLESELAKTVQNNKTIKALNKKLQKAIRNKVKVSKKILKRILKQTNRSEAQVIKSAKQVNRSLDTTAKSRGLVQRSQETVDGSRTRFENTTIDVIANTTQFNKARSYYEKAMIKLNSLETRKQRTLFRKTRIFIAKKRLKRTLRKIERSLNKRLITIEIHTINTDAHIQTTEKHVKTVTELTEVTQAHKRRCEKHETLCQENITNHRKLEAEIENFQNALRLQHEMAGGNTKILEQTAVQIKLNEVELRRVKKQIEQAEITDKSSKAKVEEATDQHISATRELDRTIRRNDEAIAENSTIKKVRVEIDKELINLIKFGDESGIQTRQEKILLKLRRKIKQNEDLMKESREGLTEATSEFSTKSQFRQTVSTIGSKIPRLKRMTAKGRLDRLSEAADSLGVKTNRLRNEVEIIEQRFIDAGVQIP